MMGRLDPTIYGLCDRLHIGQSVKQYGGRFLLDVFEKLRRVAPECSGKDDTTYHCFINVGGKTLYLKVREITVPDADNDTDKELVGHLTIASPVGLN
jgi:hypothetical protein